MQSEGIWNSTGGFFMANTYECAQYRKRPKTRNQLRRRKLIEQKVMGILLLAVCVMNIIFACNGKTVEDKDCTPILLFAPMGFYLLFTKQVVIY